MQHLGSHLKDTFLMSPSLYKLHRKKKKREKIKSDVRGDLMLDGFRLKRWRDDAAGLDVWPWSCLDAARVLLMTFRNRKLDYYNALVAGMEKAARRGRRCQTNNWDTWFGQRGRCACTSVRTRMCVPTRLGSILQRKMWFLSQ